MAPTAEDRVRVLKAKREYFKAELVELEAFVSRISSETREEEARLRLKEIESEYANFAKWQPELDHQDDTGAFIAERATIKSRYLVTVSKVQAFLRIRESRDDNPSPSIHSAQTANSDADPRLTLSEPSRNSDQSAYEINLPRMSLPKFDGTCASWPGFSEQFTTAIHDNPKLSDCQRLTYLKGCLQGEAAEIIESFSTSAANYGIAWSLLVSRYNKPAVIVSNHLKAIFEITPIAKATQSGIRSFLHTAESHYRRLSAVTAVDVDTVLIFFLLSRLDKDTTAKWKEASRETSFPKLDEFFRFLRNREDVLETYTIAKEQTQARTTDIQTNSKPAPVGVRRTQHKSNTNPTYAKTQLHTLQVGPKCSFCSAAHYNNQCTQFLEANIETRKTMVRTAKLCHNCLRPGHSVKECRSGACQRCQKLHHTLLHTESVANPNASSAANPVTCLTLNTPSEVLLSTAVIDILDAEGQSHPCRVLIDSCAQAHLLSVDFAKKLGLPRKAINVPLAGSNNMQSIIDSQTTARIQSRTSRYSCNLTFLLTPKVADRLPANPINKQQLQVPTTVRLADPDFHLPAGVDGLLGAQIFWDLLCTGNIALKHPTAKLRKTLLGWVVVGELHGQQSTKTVNTLTIDPLQTQLERFWTIEDDSKIANFSPEEQECEAYYAQTTRRDALTGRYQVRLPFKPDASDYRLDTYTTARKRFYGLERTLAKRPELKEQYSQFISEYQELGHMSRVEDANTAEGCYLPHHAVIKDDSLTTKVRVVFDASACGTSGRSLNSLLLTGPVIQTDLFSILVKFRMHAYVLTADITKMYRQIEMHPDDRVYQKILWRETPTAPLNTYQLNTVTYGTSSAPYLAIRTLHQLAHDEGLKYPRAASALLNDFYVDDLLTGTEDLTTAKQLRDELIQITLAGGFELRKWVSNDPTLLKTLPTYSDSDHLTLQFDETTKTLGILWDARRDCFRYSIKQHREPTSKRAILSQIAQLFDPLGLVGPVIVQAKLLMQKLWEIKSGWDEPVPSEIQASWLRISHDLPTLESLSVPRRIMIGQVGNAQLHGFADASERAYGACLYMRSSDGDGRIACRLICSKSRVAPLKTQSLPRLELCAALLLSRLYESIRQSLPSELREPIFWTDSTITLQWINSSPHTLKTFVANRVREIQTLSNPTQWRHIPGKENPADIISRGLEPKLLATNHTWLEGPAWLKQSETDWPTSRVSIPFQVPEQRAIIMVATSCLEDNITSKFSSLSRLVRTVAYCLRWPRPARGHKPTGPLEAEELRISRSRILKLVQTTSLPMRDQAAPLCPFEDRDGLIRVGGRLRNATIPYEQRHQILLPRRHHVTELIIRDIHQRQGHAGAQATLNAVRQKYWPIHGRTTVKRIIRGCVTCRRANPTETHYPMADLPRDRVTLIRPFLKTGVDYCGPFYIKEKRLRNTKQVKIYVAVFVCLATKAVHLETVGDMSSEAFIAALRRFFARRGRATELYSDNGSNFVGANRELRELREMLESNEGNAIIKAYLANEGIRWHFSPPRTPHFGGIWEAAVKAFKQHFTRVVKNTLLTLEAFNTYTAEIEAILNSRPLTPLSNDPTDTTALTPSHFLIGDVMTSLTDPPWTNTPTNRLSMWQQLQKLRQHFWTRWHKEYLHVLTVRSKWHTLTPTKIEPGILVILKEDNLPTMCWPLGRIINVHPGPDGVIRVVDVKTASGTYKRGVKKLSPLLPANN